MESAESIEVLSIRQDSGDAKELFVKPVNLSEMVGGTVAVSPSNSRID